MNVYNMIRDYEIDKVIVNEAHVLNAKIKGYFLI